MRDAVIINYRLLLYEEDFAKKQEKTRKNSAFLVILRNKLGNSDFSFQRNNLCFSRCTRSSMTELSTNRSLIIKKSKFKKLLCGDQKLFPLSHSGKRNATFIKLGR